ncbi:MAG: ABC transporter ATP-binding protein/permease [Candidatus Nealsonbacteria bacterium]|nr:ABC transporter ATP-binding protein/permease [Candidatus Nealsonbacteria bacterium]
MNYKSIFSHYWKFLKKYTWLQALILVSYGLGVISTNVIVPLIYKGIVDIVSVNPPNAHQQLNFLLISLVFIVILYNCFYRLGDYLLVKTQSKILKELYDYSLEKLQRHSYTFFSSTFVGGLVAKTKRFIHAFEILHDQFIFQIWMSGITLLSSLIVLWYHSAVLGLAFLIWIGFYGVIVRILVRWQIPKSLTNAEADSYTTGHYSDIVSNIFTVKMFATEKRESKNFAKTTSYQQEKRYAAWMQQVFWDGMIQGFIIAIFNIVIIWFAINLWKSGSVSTGTIVLVQVYVLTSFNIVWSISRNIIKISSAIADADEMVKIFDRKPGVKDPIKPEKLFVTRGDIRFNKVTFAYDQNNVIFNELDLFIKPGEKVALVGYSGAGKTTIIKLLLRFVDIQGGNITIDGQDITKVSQEELRKKIAYVPQDPSLFHRSLRDNIAYARPSATFQEVVNVSKRAYAHEFIDALPMKYDSLVGERGIKLSGGERQRIAIARAMIKNAPIVILDEATSSLDSIAEKKIQNALEELIKDRTTIVIAHRLSTIQKMDRIIVFKEGEIVEMGTHKELIQKSGLYFDLWSSQVHGFITEEDDELSDRK